MKKSLILEIYMILKTTYIFILKYKMQKKDFKKEGLHRGCNGEYFFEKKNNDKNPSKLLTFV